MTQEQENFYRHSTVIVDETKDSFLQLLEFHLTNQGITLQRFIEINGHYIYHLCFNRYPCCQCPPGTRAETRGNRILHPPQLDTLLDKTGTKLTGHNPGCNSAPHCCSPVNPNLQLQDLDFTLARLLLVNFTTLVPQGSLERNALDFLVNSRNQSFAHAKEGKISVSEYQKSMANIEKSLLVLAKVYGKESETRQRLRDIAKQPLNIALCLQLQNILLQQCQIDKTIKRLLAKKSKPECLTKDLEDVKIVEGCDARLELWTRERCVDVEWFKDDIKIEESKKFVVEKSCPIHRLIVTNADLTDRGMYHAKILDLKRTAKIDIEEYFTKNMAKTFECIEGDNVELSCAVSEDNIPAQWKKDEIIITPSDKYEIKDMGKSHMLSIIQLDLWDAGDYSVTINNRVRSSSIQVKEYFTKPLRTVTCIEGETVQFECEVLDDDQQALWYKEGMEVDQSDKHIKEKHGKLYRLVINKTQVVDKGEYSVKIKNCVRHSQLIVQEYFTQNIGGTIECVEGDSVELSCAVLDDNVPAIWKKNGVVIQQSTKYKIEAVEMMHNLSIIRADLQDVGEYTVIINNRLRSASLQVEEYFTKPLGTMTCLEGDTVQLECEVLDNDQTAMWFKDGSEVRTSNKYIVEGHGNFHRLVVNNTTLVDRGEYSVKIKNCVRHSQLIVQEYFTQNMEQTIECVEGDSVELTCAVLEDNVPAIWKKNGVIIQQSTKYKIEAIGMMHNLSIIRADLQDVGEYTVIINNRIRSASLQVEGIKDERFKQRCRDCDKEPSVYWCHYCKRSMCQDCNNQHRKSTDPNHHIVQHVRDMYSLDYNFKVNVELIIDIKVLHDDVLVIADYDGKKLVTCDITGQQQHTIPLRSRPLCIAVVDNNTVAVATATAVEIVNVRQRNIIKRFVVRKGCRGIMYRDEQLFVGCPNKTIKVMNMSGKVKRKIPVGGIPGYICGGESGHIYYIVYHTDYIYCIDAMGNPLFTFTKRYMTRRWGMTIDDEGHVLVICRRSKNVLRISPDGRKSQFIIAQIPAFSYICYNSLSRSVVIGHHGNIYFYKKV